MQTTGRALKYALSLRRMRQADLAKLLDMRPDVLNGYLNDSRILKEDMEQRIRKEIEKHPLKQ